jgi:hypothetical protein
VIPARFERLYWNEWLIPANRKRVLDLLASWKTYG